MSPSPHSRSSPSEKPTAIRRSGREESEEFEMTDQHLPNLTEWLEMVGTDGVLFEDGLRGGGGRGVQVRRRGMPMRGYYTR